MIVEAQLATLPIKASIKTPAAARMAIRTYAPPFRTATVASAATADHDAKARSTITITITIGAPTVTVAVWINTTFDFDVATVAAAHVLFVAASRFAAAAHVVSFASRPVDVGLLASVAIRVFALVVRFGASSDGAGRKGGDCYENAKLIHKVNSINAYCAVNAALILEHTAWTLVPVKRTTNYQKTMAVDRMSKAEGSVSENDTSACKMNMTEARDAMGKKM